MIISEGHGRTELIRGMPFSEYCKTPGLNQSLVKTHHEDYEGCGAKFHYFANHPDTKDTKAFQFGRAFHSLLLEPDEFQNLYRVMDADTCEKIFHEIKSAGYKSKSKAQYMQCESYKEMSETGARGFTSSAAYKAWIADDPDREVISAEDHESMRRMVIALMNNPDVAETLEGTNLKDCEATALWAYKIPSGVEFQLKARFDILCVDDALIDAKTCRTVSWRRFRGDVDRFGYDIQAAFYLDAAKAVGHERKRFGFLAQEKTPPFLNCIHWMPDDWVKYARRKYRTTLSEIAENIRLNDWPNPPSTVLEPPEYLKPIIELL